MKVRQRITYVAGRMRKLPLNNFPAFDRARNFLARLGWSVLSPADMDRAAGVDETSLDPWADYDQEPFIRRDVDAILRSDAIALIPGWEKSTGAVAEVMLARWAGKAIIDAETGGPLPGVKWDDIIQSFHDYLEECE